MNASVGWRDHTAVSDVHPPVPPGERERDTELARRSSVNTEGKKYYCFHSKRSPEKVGQEKEKIFCHFKSMNQFHENTEPGTCWATQLHVLGEYFLFICLNRKKFRCTVDEEM